MLVHLFPNEQDTNQRLKTSWLGRLSKPEKKNGFGVNCSLSFVS